MWVIRVRLAAGAFAAGSSNYFTVGKCAAGGNSTATLTVFQNPMRPMVKSSPLVVFELRPDASPGFIIDSAPIADPDHLFNEPKSCSLSRREIGYFTPTSEQIPLSLCGLGVSGSTRMQFETEGAAVDLACSQLDKIANGWIERTAGKVTGQPEGMAVGVWIGGIGVETHDPDGRPGTNRKVGCRGRPVSPQERRRLVPSRISLAPRNYSSAHVGGTDSSHS